jgi:YidC/Oxa1 family membrane protein insertase
VSIPFLDPLYAAVAWVIMRLHAGLGAIFGPASGWTWALTIILLVVLMRLLLVPLFVKQMHATRKMTALAPQVAELKKKYKNDRQKLNEETMKLYRENGANPLSGCLPLVAQLPVFFALFAVLRAISLGEPKYGLTPAVVASAKHASIFGATVADRFLSTLFPPTLYRAPGVGVQQWTVIFIFVLISATTTFMTVRQSMKRGMTPQVDPDNPMASSQKMMQYIVPVFALSGLYWQFGLVLYWVTTNLWTLGQQYVLFKRFPPPVSAGAAAGGAAAPGGKPPAKPSGKGAPARPAGTVTAAGRAAARQQAAAEDGTQPDAGQPAKPAGPPARSAAAQGGKAPINQLRKPAAGKPAAGKPAAGKPAAGKPAAGKPASKPAKTAKPASPAAPNGKSGGSTTNGTNPLRRLVKGRGEPEPAPAPEPEARIVRQQPVRQSRSRRSGKR